MLSCIKHVLLFLLLAWSSVAFAHDSSVTQKAGRSSIEGTLVQVSTLPSPEGNAYPDCNYTAAINIDHIVSGKSIPQKIILVIPGFLSRKYAPESKYKSGDKVRVTVVPFASMPDKVRQTQQADEIDDVNLDFYFPEKIELIADFEKGPGQVPYTGGKQTFQPLPILQTVDGKARAARERQIKRDLAQINDLLKQHGGDWDKWFESLKDIRGLYKKEFEAKAQRWVGDSFFSAGYIANDGVYSPEFVKSVVNFKNYLAVRNVDLILVRIPFKGEIVDDVFTPLPPNEAYNPYLLKMYKELLEADVEIVSDIIPRLKAARLQYPLMYWYQDFAEPHPAEGTARVVAEALAERLNRYEKINSTAKASLRMHRVAANTTSSHVFFWPGGNPAFDVSKYVEYSAVLTGDDNPLTPKQGLDSPILVAGSSFIEFPSLNLGSNIPAYLAYMTGIVPDILFRAGSDAGIPRAIAREGDAFLRNRAVCVFPIVPQVSYRPLSSPPIIDPAQHSKVLLASYAGKDLTRQIQILSGTPGNTFKYSESGELMVQAGSDGAKHFAFTIPVAPKSLDFSFFMIEIESPIGNGAVISASYEAQNDTAYKSSTQKNENEIFIFKSAADSDVTLQFSNLLPNRPITIKKISIYGIKPFDRPNL